MELISTINGLLCTRRPSAVSAGEASSMREGLAAFAIALLVGTLVEYWGHRAMHTVLLKKKHAEHHRDGDGQGWFWEFVDYAVGVIPILPLGFIYSLEAGTGFL